MDHLFLRSPPSDGLTPLAQIMSSPSIGGFLFLSLRSDQTLIQRSPNRLPHHLIPLLPLPCMKFQELKFWTDSFSSCRVFCLFNCLRGARVPPFFSFSSSPLFPSFLPASNRPIAGDCVFPATSYQVGGLPRWMPRAGSKLSL